jgi:predicted membrane chloride channel (bestrophin family)
LRPIKRIRKLFKPQVEDHEGERFIETPSNEERRYIGRKKHDQMDSNVPLEIMLYLSSYNAFLLKNGLLAPAPASALTTSLGALQDAVSGLDRIKVTPLPFAYQAHLRMTLW